MAIGTAVIDGQHRYALSRHLGESGITVNVIMLNPSTADADQDDPTMRSVMRLLVKQQCRVLWVTNLYSLRTPHPDVLTEVGMLGAMGQHNPAWLYYIAHKSDLVIAAWGAHKMASAAMPGVLANLGAIELWCWGQTQQELPRHPLYLPATTRPTRYTPPLDASSP